MDEEYKRLECNRCGQPMSVSRRANLCSECEYRAREQSRPLGTMGSDDIDQEKRFYDQP